MIRLLVVVFAEIAALRAQKSVPVLFVPGHLGSYQQMRSLAAETSYEMVRRYAKEMAHPIGTEDHQRRSGQWDIWLDWHAADFSSEPSALDRKMISNQADFVCRIVLLLLQQIEDQRNVIDDIKKPRIMLVGYSVGGIVIENALQQLRKLAIRSENMKKTSGKPISLLIHNIDGDAASLFSSSSCDTPHLQSFLCAVLI